MSSGLRWAAAALLCLAACKGEEERALTREEMLDPENCKSCHPNHYREWASSMHAYAADDPVFLAMNRLGQEDTNGALGEFCVNCHAPMAVREGKTQDGLNLDELPQHLKGVTCYFCHNAVGIDDDHNNMVRLANDTTMRGGFGRGTEDDPLPVQPAAHRAEYSTFHDRRHKDSARLCGGCHDIVTPEPGMVHLERTFAEYRESLLAQGPGFSTCQTCHMDEYTGPAANDPSRDVFTRNVHDHLWPGVDVALTPFPDREVQRAAVECALGLSAIIYDIEQQIDSPLAFRVILETFAGHNQPSGAAQDRRMWVEFIAYDAENNIIYESGTIADDEPETQPGDNTWMLRDRIFGADGEEVHMFWEAHSYESNTLLPPTREIIDHTSARTYMLPRPPARITARLRMRPMGFDVLQYLIDAGELEPSVLDAMPTFTIHSGEWVNGKFTPTSQPPACDHVCMLDHRQAECE